MFFFTFSQELWILTIFINCYYIVKHNETPLSKVQKGERALFPYFVVMNNIIPIIIVIIFGIKAEYGRSSLYCWLVRYKMDDNIFCVVLNYALKILIIIINIGFLLSIYYTIRKYYISSKIKEVQKSGNSLLKRIFWYITIQVIGGIIQTITRFISLNELMIPGVILNASQWICFGICVFINENGMQLLRKKDKSKENEDNINGAISLVDNEDSLIED